MSTATLTPATEADKLIFLVEDDLAVARLIGNVLRDYHFRCEVFHSGSELQRRLRQQVPDLVIVDLGLPDMDGMALVREVRALRRCGVVILTGRGHVGDRVMGLESGADDYIMKPFEPRELVARVRSILRRCDGGQEAPASAGGRVASFAGWRYEVDSYTLIAPDGSEKALSAGEGQMLQRFLERPNRVLPREQLLGQDDMSPYDRSIDVRISRLRRKLEDDSYSPRMIKTVYGAGYLFLSAVSWE
ncbi:response regulator transcription factor [Vogesella sp. GCM10023246]|uniref:Response regulator transcription factor n=1 Tax=Vogesella oryzagri TaxID=3160864 RepID=A0ABV1M4N9_9NEIS